MAPTGAVECGWNTTDLIPRAAVGEAHRATAETGEITARKEAALFAQCLSREPRMASFES